MENIFEYYKTAKHFCGGAEHVISSCPFDEKILETCHAIGHELVSCDYFYDMGIFSFFHKQSIESPLNIFFPFLDNVKAKILKMVRGDDIVNKDASWSYQIVQCLRYLLADKHLLNFIVKNLHQLDLTIEEVNEMSEPSLNDKWGFWTARLGSSENQPDTTMNVVSPYLENMPDKYTLGVVFPIPIIDDEKLFQLCFDIGYGELAFELRRLDKKWSIYHMRGLKEPDVVVYYNNKPPDILPFMSLFGQVEGINRDFLKLFLAYEPNILGIAFLFQESRIVNPNLKKRTFENTTPKDNQYKVMCYFNKYCKYVLGHFGYRLRGAPFQPAVENPKNDFSFHMTD